ncbi:hypothetical protein [Rickettsiales endosymbiont of Stachyamoeba lipophora]|uniref:hypothetical protein n=1 Tax=Rickettsiales endosymbiont of Stachyamoeba lipophora TaxID=2486578 RepID=UPI0013DE3204|nr:hypothetical protein [Rickettsiales endosymbiont of Stachyamoeba lipophora]
MIIPLAILGTSRSNGNTLQAIRMVYGNNIPIIDLSSLNITHMIMTIRTRVMIIFL